MNFRVRRKFKLIAIGLTFLKYEMGQNNVDIVLDLLSNCLLTIMLKGIDTPCHLRETQNPFCGNQLIVSSFLLSFE